MKNSDKLQEIALRMDDRAIKLLLFYIIGYFSNQIPDSIVQYAEKVKQ
jgi:hypothetical protein